jgi:hypothetical protein
VPRAIARHHLGVANPSRSITELSKLVSKAVAGDGEAVRFLSHYGVAISREAV